MLRTIKDFYFLIHIKMSFEIVTAHDSHQCSAALPGFARLSEDDMILPETTFL